MAEISLRQFLENHTQKEAADALGCTQGAVWQMLRRNRDIRLVLDEKGVPVSYYEIKQARRRAS